MSEEERRRLEQTNPNLHKDVCSGRLPEANSDFKAVADEYPLKEAK